MSRRYLQLYLGVLGFKMPRTLSGSIIGTRSFILTASYMVLPKLKKKNGIYCSIYLQLLMARGRREACLYRRS